MIDPEEITAKSEELGAALQAKLGLRGANLAMRLSRAGRRLPKRLHRAGAIILDAERKALNPRLMQTVNLDSVEAAFQDFTLYLNEINPSQIRRNKLLNWLAGQVFNLIVVILAMVALLRWKGLI